MITLYFNKKNYPNQIYSADNNFLYASFIAQLYVDITLNHTDSSRIWL